jgi:hypothetical protein
MASCVVTVSNAHGALSAQHASCIFATLNRRWLTKGSPHCADVQCTYSTCAYGILISCKLLVQERLLVCMGLIPFTEFLWGRSETAAQYRHAVREVGMQ